MESLEFVDVSRRLRAALTPGDLDDTLAQITAAAVAVLPDVHYASISVKHPDGQLATVAPTHDLLLDLDAFQYDHGEGPCYESAVETAHVTAPHLAEDTRWPRYAQFAGQAGIAAQAGVRLFETQDTTGALNLYSETPGAFEDFETLAELFTHQAAIALAYAREIGHLREAMKTRQLIGQAVGVIMNQYNLDEARAFAFLTRLSSHSNTKMRAVAEKVIAELAHRSD